MKKDFKQTQCVRCVMDNSAPEIVFDENGVCNFCHQAEKELKSIENSIFVWRKNNGPYDALIGLSGGVDSSFALYLAHKYGMRVLAFSIDTGYNKPEADENIMRLVEGLKVPFFRYTIDLKKFKELQATFIQAGVKNIEIPTDHVLMAATYEMAAKYGIKTVLSGGNVTTESIMPPSWGHNARDLTHIKAIYRKFAGKRLKGLPLCSIWLFNWYIWVKKIKISYILDTVVYDREKAEKILIKEFGYKSTGGKHEENYFTWWHMNYYLYNKFGIDKRKAHFSSMINSRQMTRKEALSILTTAPVYPELGIEAKAIKYPKHEHSDYPLDKWYDRIAKFVKYVSA